MGKRFRDEFRGASLGDERRSDRLAELGMALAAFPSRSFPEVLGDGAALEAAYRFFGNEAVHADDILEPHYRETIARCAGREVIAAHDTTDFVFSGNRRGLGRMRGRVERGFFAHFALIVGWDGWREPLGVLRVEPWTRGWTKKAKRTPQERTNDPTCESHRWNRGVAAVEARLDASQVIHVMDREADIYDLLVSLVEHDRRFIVRAGFDRSVLEGDRLVGATDAQPIVVTREVPLSERKRNRHAFPLVAKQHPPRHARDATLSIKADSITLRRPRRQAEALPDSVTLHVVVVEELHPPAGEQPVTWRLYTTESIDTPADIERIVDGYRCRWRIEELFKVLKTGCAIEKRQLESYEALVTALAVFLPIAWRVLRHRSLAHCGGDQPARIVLTDLQVRILRRASRFKLPRSPSILDALRSIAHLGGHLARNGPPGWITLTRGYERLLTLEEGARLATTL